jgi:hypothetical protein
MCAIGLGTGSDGRHVSLHQLIPNRFSHIVRSVAWMIRTRVRSQTSLGTFSQETTHTSRREGPQPNRAETRPNMHPHGVRVVRPRGRPKPCPRQTAAEIPLAGEAWTVRAYAPSSSVKSQCGAPPTASIAKTPDQPEEPNSKRSPPSGNNASAGLSRATHQPVDATGDKLQADRTALSRQRRYSSFGPPSSGSLRRSTARSAGPPGQMGDHPSARSGS